MLPRTLEPEVMDSVEEARDYDAMDHAVVNRVFVEDFLAAWEGGQPLLDVPHGDQPGVGGRRGLVFRELMAFAIESFVGGGLERR